MSRHPHLALLALALAAPAAAQQPAAPPQLSGSSSYRVVARGENCSFGYRITNLRYTVVGSQHSEQLPPHLVLEERTSLQQCENLDAYYSLVNGRLLFTADQPLLVLEAEPFGNGLLGVHDVSAAGALPGGDNDRTLLARLSFGGVSGAIQRVNLRGPSPDFWLRRLEWVARGPGNRVKRGTRMDINSEIDARWTLAVSFALESNSDGRVAGQVEIPVANGSMQLARARITGPFRLEAVSR
jgi:hypothetical protein